MTTIRSGRTTGNYLPVDPLAMALVEAFDTVRTTTGATAVLRARLIDDTFEVDLSRSYPELIAPGDKLVLPPEFLPGASTNRGRIQNIRTATDEADQFTIGPSIFAKNWGGAKAANVSNSWFSFGPVRTIVSAETSSGDYILLLSLRELKVDLAGAAGMVAVLANFASAGDHLAQDIAHLRLRAESFESAAAEDSMTGLANRAGFRTAMAAEQRRRIRYPGNTTIVMVDLDGLKGVNDRQGHSAGDAFIISTANVLRQTCRVTDIVARLGGDEFVVLAPETDAIGADILVRRLRENFANNAISASIGSASANGPNNDLQLLLRSADESMYLEKRNKRSRLTNAV